jgi:hypothetical protein
MNIRHSPKALFHKLFRFALLTLAVVGPLVASGAPTIWNGPLINFSKLDGADPNLAANQDRLTPSDWITRGNAQGLFNASSESAFTHFLSPADTMWADGTLANYNSLVYRDWNTWAKGVHSGPPSTVGVQAVLHLLTPDIYLSIKFTSWTSGGGGGFSYVRSTPTLVPEPTSALLLMGGLAAVAGIRKLKDANR